MFQYLNIEKQFLLLFICKDSYKLDIFTNRNSK